MADAAIAIDRLKALEIALNFPAEIAFDDDLEGVNSMNDGVDLFRRQIFGPGVGINGGGLENALGMARADSIDITKGGLDALLAGNFYSK